MSENCLFCKIIKGEIPSKKIYEDDDVFAFYDIANSWARCSTAPSLSPKTSVSKKAERVSYSTARPTPDRPYSTSTCTWWADKSWAGPRSQRNSSLPAVALSNGVATLRLL